MGDVVKVFERFLARDLVFILAGAVPLLCLGRILWVEGSLRRVLSDVDFVNLSSVSWVWLALAVGAAYALGYAAQELFCLIFISSTAIGGEPWLPMRLLFRAYERRPWDTPRFNERDAAIDLEMSDNEAFGAHFERRVHLMQVGTALGPSFILSGGLLFWWFYHCVTLDKNVGVILMTLGGILLILGQLKRAQLREYVFIAHQRLSRGTQ